MAGYDIRALADLSKAARGYFTGAIEGAVASVWANTFTVFAKVLALLDFQHELRRRWLFKQIFASTADDLWLDRHAFELGLTRSPGAAALGQVRLSASSSLLVPAGLVFVRGDGVAYVGLAPALAEAGAVVLYVEASAPGALGNCAAGEPLTLSPDSIVPAGLGMDALVVPADDGTGLAGGTDAETTEAFRRRVLARKRNPPQGGAALDYRAWTHEALDTVLDVYVDVFTNDARSIWLQFTVTDQPNGIPAAAQVARVQDYVDDPIRRPVTARVFVTAPTPVTVPIVIRRLTPDTPDIRASIAAELAAAFIDRARPGTPSAEALFYRSWLVEAISRAVDEDGHDLSAPAADLTFGAGQYPVLGPISYTN